MSRLLVVDDVEALLFASAAYFEAVGWHVVTAATDAAARDAMAREPFDAVLTDLRLGGDVGEGGLDLARHVRAHSPDTRIVLLTGFVTPDLERRASELGVDRVMGKPQRLAELSRVLKALLDRV